MGRDRTLMRGAVRWCCVVALFAVACLGSQSPESLSAEQLLVPLTMRSLEQQAIQAATHHNEQQIIQRADGLQSKKNSQDSEQQLKTEADAYLSKQKASAQSAQNQFAQEARKMHAQQDSQQAALMKAVAKEKAKQAAQHKQLVDAAHMRQDDKDLQESSLSNSATGFTQSKAQERAEKAQQARTARREFLEQAQKLTTAAVDAIGTKKEKQMSQSAQISQAKAFSATAAYEKAKQNTELESQAVARADDKADNLVIKELKVKNNRVAKHASAFRNDVGEFKDNQKKVQTASIKRWNASIKKYQTSIKHGAWKPEATTDLGEAASKAATGVPCTALQRLQGDPLCMELEAPEALAVAQEATQVEQMLNP